MIATPPPSRMLVLMAQAMRAAMHTREVLRMAARTVPPDWREALYAEVDRACLLADHLEVLSGEMGAEAEAAEEGR